MERQLARTIIAFQRLAFQRLAFRAIAPVALLDRRLAIGLIAQMVGQFSAQHPLHKSNLEFLHQTLIAQQIVRVLNAA